MNASPAPPRVTATDKARALLAEIRQQHPDILIHQSCGCCDGSSPMCYPASDFRVGARDVKLGEIDGVEVYMSNLKCGATRNL